MRKLFLMCASLCAFAFAVADSAQAINQFSYVSNAGNDSNGCSNPTTDACGSLAHALGQTASYGEIDCVNTGDYGDGFTISQSITIDCAGGVGQEFGDITINGPGIVVRLRNMTINRVGYAYSGIIATNMAALYVENCVITNDNGAEANLAPYTGIQFAPTANAQLFVSNSVISNNGSSNDVPSGGIEIIPASGVTATVSIDHSQINGNFFGVIADGKSGGTIYATVSNSVVSGNTEDGIAASSSGSPAWVFVDQTEVSGNGFGVGAGGSGAKILVNNSSIVANTTGLYINGGSIYSYGNNRLNGNTTAGAFTGAVGLQ
jgi:hypothetical protein